MFDVISVMFLIVDNGKSLLMSFFNSVSDFAHVLIVRVLFLSINVILYSFIVLSSYSVLVLCGVCLLVLVYAIPCF